MTYDSEKIKRILDSLSLTSYPVVADTGANAPFVTYRRTDIEWCKDNITEAWYELTLVADTYATSVAMLATVIGCGEWEIKDTGEETYSDGYYMQTLTVLVDVMFNA